MTTLQVFNETRDHFLAVQGRVAGSFWERGKGLIGVKELADGGGLLIEPCNSVHCMFMSIPIDVLYLDREDRVVHIDAEMRPWRVGRIHRRARKVLELPAGKAKITGTRVGDQLRLRHN
jgi:uncharacterized protein